MNAEAQSEHPSLDLEGMLQILDLVRVLARPFKIDDVLRLVIDAGRAVLGADRGSIFLYDAEEEELYSTVATGDHEIRFSVNTGIAGECARARRTINVHDCYSDPRFNREFDIATGYRTRSMINVPLVGLDEELIGVLQLINSRKPFFDETDERIAAVLTDQAAVAIQRVRLMEDRMAKLDMEHDINIARDIQQRILPSNIAEVQGYELAVFNRPADVTGGDVYDVIPVSGIGQPAPGPASPVMLLVADATGHGIGPALSVTQARSMIRIALRFNSDLDSVITQVNNQLCDDLDRTRFIAAFIGLLDPMAHRIDYHACGQGPVLHFRAATGECDRLKASTLPMGVIHDIPLDRPAPLAIEPGDIVFLLTDGFFECYNPKGDMLGADAVVKLMADNRHLSAKELLDVLISEADRFADGADQADDLTAVIVKRRSA